MPPKPKPKKLSRKELVIFVFKRIFIKSKESLVRRAKKERWRRTQKAWRRRINLAPNNGRKTS